MTWHGTVGRGEGGGCVQAPRCLSRNLGLARFTLIELLMVLAIISLLAGLILPATSKVRERARLADCLGLVRQLGIAVTGYANDNGDSLPVCTRLDPQPYLHAPSLRQLLKTYVETDEAFHCPGDRGGEGLFATAGTSYEWNTFLNGHRIDRATLRLVDMEISMPLLGDAERFHGSLGRNYLYSDGRVTQSLEVLIREY